MQAEGEYTYLGYDAIAQGYADLCEPPQLHAQLYAAYAAAITAHVPARGLLLDLGCGPGFYARALAKHGLRVIAGDISQQMLALSAHPPLPAAILPCRLNA
jgi:SAM-dependent methyltransferase